MINKKKSILLLLITSLIFAVNAPVMIFAQDTEDESATFNSVAPDALILLDLSGSMAQNPDEPIIRWAQAHHAPRTAVPDIVPGTAVIVRRLCQNSHTGCLQIAANWPSPRELSPTF